MLKPDHEVEVGFAAMSKELAEVGCPYKADDPLSKAWLDGYSTALKWSEKTFQETRA